MLNKYIKKLFVCIIMVGSFAFSMQTGELTRDLPFANLQEAAAYVASGKAVDAGMVSDIIWNKNLDMLEVLAQSNTFPLNRYQELIGSPLGDAISSQATAIIHYLINTKGVKPTNNHIHLALSGSHHVSLQALLKYHVDIHGTNSQGRTPIQFAESRGDQISVQLLKAYTQ